MVWIKIRIPPRCGWGFPLVLPVLEETLEEMLEFLILWKPLLARYRHGRVVYGLFPTALNLLREVRDTGPYTLVRADTEEASVDIRLI